ncbi:DUF1917 domain-containing protein [Paraburkholderia sp. Se-20369]|nr:DUF1917 domain-containing protein [Paraburkholderia sp. Se-20369]
MPVLQPTVLHSAPSHEGNLIDLSDPPTTPKPTSTPSSLLEATPDELQSVAHHPVLQPTVLHPAHAASQPTAKPSTAAPATAHEPHGAHDAPPLAASGMPSVHDIEHDTRQTIRMQHAIGRANQLLAVAEMLNSFRMKLLDMIKKAVSPS